MRLINYIKRNGFKASMVKILRKIGYYNLKLRTAPIYRNPTEKELVNIEAELNVLGVKLNDAHPSPAAFDIFQQQNWFPSNYHGGIKSGVWKEKLLEHFLASELLELMNYGKDDIYVDVAASGSPWVKNLRDRKNIKAFAIDLDSNSSYYSDLDYYRIENAKSTSFADDSVKGVSLQCAYEMFNGNDDIKFIKELKRILVPGGKAIILPLYMHTHACAYSSPEYFGKNLSDASAKEYVRFDCSGVHSARKYSTETLQNRVLEHVVKSGMQYRIHVLRNKNLYGKGIYCHFILEIEK